MAGLFFVRYPEMRFNRARLPHSHRAEKKKKKKKKKKRRRRRRKRKKRKVGGREGKSSMI